MSDNPGEGMFRLYKEGKKEGGREGGRAGVGGGEGRHGWLGPRENEGREAGKEGGRTGRREGGRAMMHVPQGPSSTLPCTLCRSFRFPEEWQGETRPS